MLPLLLSGCFVPFPPRPVADDVADSGAGTDTDPDTIDTFDTETGDDTGRTAPPPDPVVHDVDDADAVLLLQDNGRYALGLVGVDPDAQHELLLARPWQAKTVPAAWEVVQPVGVQLLVADPSLTALTFPVGEGSGACLDDLDHPVGAFQMPSGTPGLDVDGDGWDDLAVGIRSSQSGGGYAAVVHSSGDPLADTGPQQLTQWCHPAGGLDFARALTLVADGGEGTPILVGIGSDSNSNASIVVLDVVPPGGGMLDVLVESPAKILLGTMEEGASQPWGVGAVDPDGNGVGSVVVATIGEVENDPATRFVLIEGPLSDAAPGGAGSLIAGRVLGAAGDPDACGLLAELAVGDVDGDGAEDLVSGFPLDGRVIVAGEVTADVPASSLPGATGPAACFGGRVAVIGDLTGDGADEVAVGAPSGDGGGWVFDGARLAAGALDADTDALVVLVARAGVGGGLGASLVSGGDLDGDGVPDLVIGEEPNTPTGGRLYLHSGAGLLEP